MQENQRLCPPAKHVKDFLCNNSTTINTQANCQQLIMSDLCPDGADEIILPTF